MIRSVNQAGWVALILLAATSAVACRSPAPVARPSLVVVLIDTLRPDYLGCQGFDGDVSPQIDRLAAEGMVFDAAFSQAPWTKPSVATLFTGLYPEVHNVLTEGGKYRFRGRNRVTAERLSDEVTTLAEALHDAGYATGAFVGNPWVRAEGGLAQGFDVFHHGEAPADSAKSDGAPLVAAARTWIAERGESPFFLYLHLMEVHAPYDAPEADFAAVASSSSLGASLELSLPLFVSIPTYMRQPTWTAESEGKNVRTWRGRYAAGVRSADRLVGQLRDALAEAGVFESTVFLVTSDHGEELHDHRSWDHGYRLFDEQLRVPLVVRLPHARNAGRRYDGIVRLVDVMPSLLGMAGVAAPAGVQGRDLAALWRGEIASVPDVPSIGSAVKWKPEMRSVRTRRYKLIQEGAKRSAELYDLATDPGEQHDVARHAPSELGVLEKALQDQLEANARRGPAPAATVALSASEAERLRALGYLEQK